MSESHIRSITNRSGRAHHLLGGETVTEPLEEKIEDAGDAVIKSISGGGNLPPEPAPDDDHNHDKKPPSDQTVIIVSVLYIGGGLFMIGLGVSALRAMNKRRKERGK